MDKVTAVTAETLQKHSVAEGGWLSIQSAPTLMPETVVVHIL